MNTFQLIISSPDGDLYRGTVRMLILRGTEGDLAVMAGHVPFVTGVRKGKCVIVDADGKRFEGSIADGLLSVGKEQVTVLSTSLSLQEPS